MTDILPPKKWEKTKWLPPTQEEITAGAELRPDFEYIGRTFGRICCLKARIRKISFLSEANQASWENGQIDDIQPHIMNDAYVDVQWNSDAFIPEELLTHTRITKCVYDCGLFHTAHREFDAGGNVIDPLIHGFQNIPWLAFTHEVRNIEPDNFQPLSGNTYSETQLQEYLIDFPLDQLDTSADIVLILYDPINKDSNNISIPLQDRLILVGHSRYAGIDGVDNNRQFLGLGGIANTIHVAEETFLVSRNGYVNKINIKDGIIDYPDDYMSFSKPSVLMPTLQENTKLDLFNATNKIFQCTIERVNYFTVTTDLPPGWSTIPYEYPLWEIKASRCNKAVASNYLPDIKTGNRPYGSRWINPMISRGITSVDYQGNILDEWGIRGRDIFEENFDTPIHTDDGMVFHGIIYVDPSYAVILCALLPIDNWGYENVTLELARITVDNDNKTNVEFIEAPDDIYWEDSSSTLDDFDYTIIRDGKHLIGSDGTKHLLQDYHFYMDVIGNQYLMSFNEMNVTSSMKWNNTELFSESFSGERTQAGFNEIITYTGRAITNHILCAYLYENVFTWIEVTFNFSGTITAGTDYYWQYGIYFIDFLRIEGLATLDASLIPNIFNSITVSKKCMLNGITTVLETYTQQNSALYGSIYLNRTNIVDGASGAHEREPFWRVTNIPYLNNIHYSEYNEDRIRPRGGGYISKDYYWDASYKETEYITASEDGRLVCLHSRRLDNRSDKRNFLFYDGELIDDDFEPDNFGENNCGYVKL